MRGRIEGAIDLLVPLCGPTPVAQELEEAIEKLEAALEHLSSLCP